MGTSESVRSLLFVRNHPLRVMSWCNANEPRRHFCLRESRTVVPILLGRVTNETPQCAPRIDRGRWLFSCNSFGAATVTMFADRYSRYAIFSQMMTPETKQEGPISAAETSFNHYSMNEAMGYNQESIVALGLKVMESGKNKQYSHDGNGTPSACTCYCRSGLGQGLSHSWE